MPYEMSVIANIGKRRLRMQAWARDATAADVGRRKRGSDDNARAVVGNAGGGVVEIWREETDLSASDMLRR